MWLIKKTFYPLINFHTQKNNCYIEVERVDTYVFHPCTHSVTFLNKSLLYHFCDRVNFLFYEQNKISEDKNIALVHKFKKMNCCTLGNE